MILYNNGRRIFISLKQSNYKACLRGPVVTAKETQRWRYIKTDELRGNSFLPFISKKAVVSLMTLNVKNSKEEVLVILRWLTQ